jgi:hypothetical protein
MARHAPMPGVARLSCFSAPGVLHVKSLQKYAPFLIPFGCAQGLKQEGPVFRREKTGGEEPTGSYGENDR